MSLHNGNGEQTHDTHSRLSPSTAYDPSPSQQVTSHRNHTTLGGLEHHTTTHLDHVPSHRTESPRLDGSTYHSLGQYAAQQQTLENYTLDVWRAQSPKEGSVPFPVVPKQLHGASDWGCRVADGNKYDCGSDTGATWGGSVDQGH